VADYWFIDGEGRVLATIEGFEHTASASLNALTGRAGDGAAGDGAVVTR
jgi:hypothetical protein